MSTSPEKSPAPALKEMFDAARFSDLAMELTRIDPAFDSRKFLKSALDGLDDLSLMQRLRRMTESLHATLPADFSSALERLRLLAPRINKAFVTLVLPDFVGRFGLHDFDASMAALKFFTVFGSSEFAIREFLRMDQSRTLAVMLEWSSDPNEHVRRLASEGCRPRLPWSFRLESLNADPRPVLPILENLKGDPSLYVRKSVANHLNDITKTHPDWVLERLQNWPMENPHTAWIARHALRTLIKKGHAGALALIGATGKAQLTTPSLTLRPDRLLPGGSFTLCMELHSTAALPQRLVIDYAVHYVKKSGATSAKVFKWKEITLLPGETIRLTRRQTIRDFTTRIHYPGWHRIGVLINGEVRAESGFTLNGKLAAT